MSDFVVAEFGRLSGGGPECARALYARFRAAVLAEPARHGWRIEGRLTSYVDEDVFAVPTSSQLRVSSTITKRTAFFPKG